MGRRLLNNSDVDAQPGILARLVDAAVTRCFLLIAGPPD